jgi:hypothetical protein
MEGVWSRVLRKIFGPERGEVMGERRKLHSGELRDFYSSSSIIRQIKSRRMRLAGHVAYMGEERKVYKVLVGKPKRKRPLRRPRLRWEDGIGMDLREIGQEGVVWIHLAQNRDFYEHDDEPSGSGATDLVSSICHCRLLQTHNLQFPAFGNTAMTYAEILEVGL